MPENRLSLEILAAPYTVDRDEFLDKLFPVRTSTQLGDATDAINTVDKFTGRMVFNSTTGEPAWAAGPGATDDWLSADITVGVTITPS